MARSVEPMKKATEPLFKELSQMKELSSQVMVKLLNAIQAVAVAAMQQTIKDLKTPPNAASTIAAKKSSNPLIDTGLLVNTVTFKIRGAGS